MSSYEVYAVKYAEREAVRAEHFIGGDIHDNSPMPMDYFVWVIRDNHQNTWVVDTGFEEDDATARGRTLLRTAAEGVALIGVDPETVSDVITTMLAASSSSLMPFFTFKRQRWPLLPGAT